MANEDEFGFRELAASFRPEVEKEQKVEKAVSAVVPPAIPKVVASKPVTPSVAMPPLPAVNPAEVAASVPQPALPELPQIQNPVFNPEFQKAAGVALAPAILGGAALGAASAYAGSKAIKSIKERSMSQATGVPSVDNKTPPPANPMQQAQERIAANKQILDAQKATQAPAPVASPTTPSVGEAVATGGNVDQSIKQTVANELDKANAQPQTLKTGTGREVVAGQGVVPQRFSKEYKTAADVPKGYAFVPGAQHIDTLRNNLGQQTYTEHYTNRPFPSNYNEALAQSNEINRSLGRATREGMRAQGIEPPKPTTGITRKIGENKVVKVGGVLGALVALPELAHASSEAKQGNVAPAKEFGFDLGTAALLAKILGGPASAAAALLLGSNTLADGTLDSPEARALGVKPR